MIPKIRPNIHSLLPIMLGPLLALFVWLAPLSMNLEAQKCAGIIVWVALWWLSPIIPLHISGIIGVMLAHFFQLASWKELLTSFADPIIFLFLGGFVLARAVEFHQIDRLMVQKTMKIRGIAGNAQTLFLALVVLTAMMSGFLSNTATTALVFPIGLEILKRHSLDFKKTGKLVLLLAGAASIGGTMTPIGSPPNMIALALMEKITGTRPDFLTWMLHMVPLAICMLAALIWLYRAEWRELPQVVQIEEAAFHLKNEQRYVLLILITTGILWAIPGLFPLMGLTQLGVFTTRLFPESVVAVLALIALVLWPTRQGPLLPWSEAQKIDWGTLLLFGSGLAIGDMAFKSGLAQLLGAKLETLAHLSPEVLLSLAVIATLSLTEIASNTATANLIVPILLASSSFAMTPERTIYAIVAAANLAFMLPVGTPPNAIVFSTGVFSFGTMLRKGFLANILSGMLILIFSLLFF